jgi:hypothetical protein
MIDALLTSIFLPLSPCGGNGYYDPQHQVCQPYLPANPQPGYDQTCSGGYYHPAHGVCAPYEPAYPPPFYHRRDNASGGFPGE